MPASLINLETTIKNDNSATSSSSSSSNVYVDDVGAAGILHGVNDTDVADDVEDADKFEATNTNVCSTGASTFDLP